MHESHVLTISRDLGNDALKRSFGAEAIGRRIKIYVKQEETFAEGVIDAYFPSNRRHRVLFSSKPWKSSLQLHKEQVRITLMFNIS